MSNLLLVFMFLFFTAPSILFKIYFLAVGFCIYGGVFGFMEFIAKFYTGHTVSQQIGDLVEKKKFKLLAYMLAGWVCFVAHYFFTGIISIGLFALYFLLLAIPSVIYKEYFLTLASTVFVLSIGSADALSLQLRGVTIAQELKLLFSVHPLQVITIAVFLVLGWMSLLVHLGMRFKK